jgi:ATPase subunit of ABC transporter with duplicated ATPase domains
MSEDKKIIFSMTGVSKILPNNNKAILKDIFLSFYYGAKIGIIGLNGSGKSTLLKIIAGEEKNYQGDVIFSEDFNVGYLEQEPALDNNKTVIEVIQEGVADTMSLLEEYNSINEQFGLPEVYENP